VAEEVVEVRGADQSIESQGVGGLGSCSLKVHHIKEFGAI